MPVAPRGGGKGGQIHFRHMPLSLSLSKSNISHPHIGVARSKGGAGDNGIESETALRNLHLLLHPGSTSRAVRAQRALFRLRCNPEGVVTFISGY